MYGIHVIIHRHEQIMESLASIYLPVYNIPDYTVVFKVLSY
jgi:hypothetical protein